MSSIGFGAELLGWTPVALHEIEHLRGWTEAAIERLELGYHPDEQRIGIPVRDEHGAEHGELRYDPTGRLNPKMRATAGSTRQLFPPPELIDDHELDEHRTVWLTEGEPDAIRLWSLGLAAVAVPGAGNWRDEWAARFSGRRWRVPVCFDCDEPGREAARRAATALVNAGVDARIVELDPARDDGYDLTDWTRLADTAELRAQAAAALTAIADALELYQPERGEHDGGGRPWRSVTWSAFRDESPPAHRWLVDGLLPAGTLAFVAGPPKRGKTWLGITIALAIALGVPLAPEPPGKDGVRFDGFAVPEPRDVLYVALEGSQTGLRTRIGALARGAGADPDTTALDRLHMLYRPRPFDLAELATADWLLQEAVDVDAALVIVDVLRAAARFQENAAEDFARIRDHLTPLLEDDRTVALLHHFGKLNDTQKERSPGERMAGTGAMYGALDVGLLITKSDNGARTLRVDVEARDFAAPDALGLAILGDGTGKHGGFTYLDRAQLVTDEEAAGREDIVGKAVAYFEQHPDWLAGDDLGEAIASTRRTIEAAAKADTESRATLELPPRLVRWDRDGRELPPKPDGTAWKANARPWGTPAMLEHAADQRLTLDESLPGPAGPSRPDPARSGPGPSGPSRPSSPDQLGPAARSPSKEGNRGTEQADPADSGRTEQ